MINAIFLAYGVYISNLKRYSRAYVQYSGFLDIVQRLKQGYLLLG